MVEHEQDNGHADPIRPPVRDVIDVEPENERLVEEPPREEPAVDADTPWLTHAIVGICLVLWAYLNFAGGSPQGEQLMHLVAPRATDIWAGSAWGLITSAFVHLAFWHIGFNMIWAFFFGRVMETALGRVRYLAFVLFAAVASSGVQMLVSSQTGIGYSGVVCAMFGYGIAAQHTDRRFALLLPPGLVRILLGSMVIFILLEALHLYQGIANGAHVGGFLFGFFVGTAFARRIHVVPCVVGLVVLFAAVALSVTYLPWSPAWKLRGQVSQIVDIQRRAHAGDPEAQYLYGAMLRYADRDPQEANGWLRKAAEQGYAPAMNGLAWTLATDPDDGLRDGQTAVKWALMACEKSEWREAAYIDTLAAAYAEIDDWDQAVATQEKAIAALTEAEAKHAPGFDRRLEQFRNQEKVREPFGASDE